MEQTVLTKNPLSRWQHGFRRTKSTETAIAEVVNYIESAMYRGEFAVAICLDIQGAFDNLNAAKANEALRNHGFPPWFLNWYGKFLHRRFVSVEYKGSKVLGEVTKGTPQGDVISTMAWDVGYDPLLVNINTKTACDGNGFADDCITLMKGKFLIDVLRECQKAINIAYEWGLENGLTFNAAKTEVIIFTNKYRYDVPFHLSMGGQQIEYKSEVKYLGVTIDDKLRWHKHLNFKIKVAKQKLMMLKSVITKYSGPSNFLLEWAYRGIVIPSLAYGSIAWHTRLKNLNVINKLRQLNRLAMLLLTQGVYKSTPTKSMEILLNYPPLHLVLGNEATKALVRVQGKINLKWDGIGNDHKRGSLLMLRKESKAIMDVVPFLGDESKRLNYYKPYVIEPEHPGISHMKGRCHIIKYRNQWTTLWSIEYIEQLVCYKAVNFIAHNNISLQLTTLRELLEEIERRKIEKIEITVDKDLIWVLSRYVNSDKLLNDTIECIRGSKAEITFRLGDPKKTRKYASKLRIPKGITHMPYSPVFRQDHIDDLLAKRLQAKWNEEWAADPTYGTHTRKWLPNATPCESIKTWHKKDIGLIVRLVTGHGPFKYHISKCEPDKDPICDLCDEEEQTANHLILECPALSGIRRDNTEFSSVITNISPTGHTS